METGIRIGEYVLRYRREHGLSQRELASMLGVSFQAVSKWERSVSYPDLCLLPEISTLLGISIDEMMGLKPPKTAG